MNNEKRSPVFISGPNVNLVPQDKKKHLENYLIWMNDPDVRQYVLRQLPITRPEEEAWLDGQGDDSAVHFAVELADGTHIGSVGIHKIDWKNRSGEMGIIIGDPEQRERGYGYEIECLIVNYAFCELNLHRVEATVFTTNPRSMNCAKKVGFKQEGIMRERMFKNGKHIDVIMGSILAHEWPGLPWEKEKKT